MLHTLDDSGKLFGYTQKSCDQAMKEEGVGKSVVNDLINPIIRWNLGQNSDNVSGLTGKKKNIHIVRAFELAAEEVCIINSKMTFNFQVFQPSLKHITNLLKFIINIDDKIFNKSVFAKLNDGQKHCIILTNEVYSKSMLSYYGGQHFGKLANNNSLFVLNLKVDRNFL